MTRKFSERIGVTTEPIIIQLDSMDKLLRNSIWNIMHNTYQAAEFNDWKYCVEFAAQYFFKFPVDELPYGEYKLRGWLKKRFWDMEWYQVYNFIEFIAENYGSTKRRSSYGRGDFIKSCNDVFETELSGYRFISGVLSPITNKEEVSEISEAIEKASIKNLFGTREHLQTALSLLGKKPDPDYRNSIKEAISAVESISKQITGSSSKGLSGALEILSEQTEIHGALKSAFNKLYGYTSDADGIRHAILDETNVGFDEAKFMLVSCSAFINFMISKAEKAGVLTI